MISSPHAHTLPPSRHTPFVKYYLSRWFSIFQWLTGTHIWSGIFQCCEEGTCRALLNMAGENTLISHTFYTQNVSFSINTAIFALWVTFCVCPVSCCPSGCFKAWREHYYLSYCTVLSSFSFCVTVPVKKKERKAPYSCRNLYSCLSLASFKWARLCVSLLSADCVTSVYCFFIMSFSLAAFLVWEKSKLKMNSKSVDSTA